MDISKRFTEIRQFIQKHQYLCDLEALSRYPLENHPYTTWQNSIANLSEHTKHQLENTYSPELVEDLGYKEFLTELIDLITLPKQVFEEQEIDPILGRKIKAKKRHEIQVMLKQLQDKPIKHFVDIGSGAGHLSSLLLFKNNKNSTCIDMNAANQLIGQKKLKSDFPEILKRIKFENQLIGEDFECDHSSASALLGLHACGDLSVHLIKKFTQSDFSHLLSYGCCYHKLSQDAFNLSQAAQSSPLKLTNHALTMATKSYKPISKKEYEFRKRVKHFRYTLHILLKDHFKEEFTAVGSAEASDYQGEFADYCFKYKPELSNHFNKQQLEEFFLSEKNQRKLNQLLDFGIIRSHMARLIELYIILDRALYLQEHGFKVEVNETFSKEISPRNISLMASRT